MFPIIYATVKNIEKEEKWKYFLVKIHNSFNKIHNSYSESNDIKQQQ